MEVREFSVNELSAQWIAGSENGPLCALVVELGPILYDTWRLGHSSVLAACAYGADDLGLDYGKLVNVATPLYRTNPNPDLDFFALLLRCSGADPSLAGPLLDYYEHHHPEVACNCGVIPMFSMLGKRYPLGLMSLGPSSREMSVIDALGLGSRFGSVYLKPEGLGSWPNLPALRWFESSLCASGSQVAYIAPPTSPVLADVRELGWLTVAVGADADAKNSCTDHVIHDVLELEGLIESHERSNGEALHAVLVEDKHDA